MARRTLEKFKWFKADQEKPVQGYRVVLRLDERVAEGSDIVVGYWDGCWNLAEEHMCVYSRYNVDELVEIRPTFFQNDVVEWMYVY